MTVNADLNCALFKDRSWFRPETHLTQRTVYAALSPHA